MFESSTIIKRIFYTNIVIYLITIILPSFIYENFALYNFQSEHSNPIQLITYQYVHGGFLHLLFNMLMMLSLLPTVENRIGSNKFLLYYTICGIFSALFHLFIQPGDSVLVGASGSLMGMLIFYVLLNPNELLNIFFIPIDFKAKYLLGFYILMECILAIFGTSDGVSHYGHIGGFISGLILYFINFRKTINFRNLLK